MPPDEVRLRHMLDAARKAVGFANSRSRTDLDTDEELALAIVRLLEIIGEAANRVSPAMRSRYPSIHWNEIAGMRNRLIHGYFDVDLDVVWATVTLDLPELIDTLGAALEHDV